MRVPIIGLVALHAGVAIADVELRNDGFESGDAAGFQGGFVAGEIGAARFVAPEAGRTLLKVQLLYGPDGPQRTVRLIVYDDTAGTIAPGSELYGNDFQLTGSSTSMHEISITDQQVTLPAQFRVGIQFNDDNSPSIAGDKDGTRTAGKNFIFAIPGGWMEPPFPPAALGDWIIRPFVSGTGGPGPGPDGGPVGGDCTGNGDCPVGQFCDTAVGSCTFECREDSDCGDGSCNSLGQCVAGGDGGGCCRTDRGGTDIGALVFGGLFGVLVLRRRRRCA